MGGLFIDEDKGMKFFVDDQRRLVRTFDEEPATVPQGWRRVTEEEYVAFRAETKLITAKKLKALRERK